MESKTEKRIKVPLTLKDLSDVIEIKANEIIKKLINGGIFLTVNQLLDKEEVEKILHFLHYPGQIKVITDEEAPLLEDRKGEGLVVRPPVVTLMGHIDHGKTSLLDAIRNTYVVEREKGGITQHIGAYQVSLDKGTITFLDTPGHQAFTAMRARGANVADIVVLVVAANEGVKPQTIEAIDHARAANVAIMVAINKIDLPDVNIERVKTELQKLGLTPEEWGGETIMVEVSAKTKQGIDELLEMILLEAEMLELKADPASSARGVVIEGKVSAGRGVVISGLVQTGTLRVGDVIVADCYYAKVRALIDDKGERIKEAGPSMPVEILGFSDLPQVGEVFYAVENEKRAKEICWLREERKKKQELTPKRKISLETLSKEIKEKHLRELKLIVKADVQGSLEALVHALNKLSTSKVGIQIIHQATGGINESDIILASVSNAIVIGFHVRASAKAEELASQEGVDIKVYDIIYEAINEIKASLEGLLEPVIKDVSIGKAEVRQVFKIPKVGTVAGCFVLKGRVRRNDLAHLIRNDVVIYDGRIRSLKRFKEDVREVEEGFECGMSLENYNDIKIGDVIEVYEKREIAQKLEE
ncbi:MAG: translation initiation factor IF-2 [Candidatus Omnitrophota bacterium]|nr:MAG: translation initiation factor IF-2 [Candidatus Omnitrophota bacterium]